MKKLPHNDLVLMAMSLNAGNGKVFPRRLKQRWLADNYGPLIIPKKGVRIALNDNTIPIYYAVIKEEEKNVRINQHRIYVNNTSITSYTFKNDYYFMMGDNRNHSFDSRWLGFISDKLVIGKAAYVIHSENKKPGNTIGKFCFKKIR